MVDLLSPLFVDGSRISGTWPRHPNTASHSLAARSPLANDESNIMAFLQPVPNTLGGWVTTFPFFERPGHVGFGSYCVRQPE
jgi:hypothetical protein